MNTDPAQTTAADLARASLAAIREKDKGTWLDLFEEDAVVQDPVGPSRLDPEGRGRQGKEEISRFYDDVIAAMSEFDYDIERSYLCGDEVAMAVTFTITMGTTTTTTAATTAGTPEPGAAAEPLVMDVVNVYRRSPAGRLASLRSFWDGSRQGR